MQLTNLFSDTSLETKIPENFADIDIVNITADSRQVSKGSVFFALPGTQVNGAEFIPNAISLGATVIVAEPQFQIDDKEILFLGHENPRKLLSETAACLFPGQPENIVAVTGTNGKSSTVHFCQQIWDQLKLKSASLGTLGLLHNAESEIDTPKDVLTTFDPVTLHQIIDQLANSEISHLAIEASSHGLDQYRLDGLKLKAAAFTNLTQDHLDYHKTIENYFNAKMRLFGEILPKGTTAVINSDIGEYEQITSQCKQNSQSIISFGNSSTDANSDLHIGISAIAPSADGLQVTYKIEGKESSYILPLAGDFQAYNIACAIGLCIAAGASKDDILNVVGNLTAPAGRMQQAGKIQNGGVVYVDFAHTEDALEKALSALRPYAINRVLVVFGCGGDRDQGKRSKMGEIAAKLADYIIITDDNPRTEDPAKIRQMVKEGCKNHPNIREIASRSEAINFAVGELEQGDILLIAGKGHENYQIVGSEKLHFDDVEEASSSIAKRNAKIGANA